MKHYYIQQVVGTGAYKDPIITRYWNGTNWIPIPDNTKIYFRGNKAKKIAVDLNNKYGNVQVVEYNPQTGKYFTYV